MFVTLLKEKTTLLKDTAASDIYIWPFLTDKSGQAADNKNLHKLVGTIFSLQNYETRVIIFHVHFSEAKKMTLWTFNEGLV